MKNIKKTTVLVKEILQKVPATRNDDHLLYYYTIAACGCDIDKCSVKYFFMSFNDLAKQYGCPSFKSVERSRRKVQRAYPELAGSDQIEGFRAVNEQIVRDYARQVKV